MIDGGFHAHRTEGIVFRMQILLEQLTQEENRFQKLEAQVARSLKENPSGGHEKRMRLIGELRAELDRLQAHQRTTVMIAGSHPHPRRNEASEGGDGGQT